MTLPPPDASPARPIFRRALRDCLLLLAVLLVTTPVIGWFVSGWPGVWGALVGVALAAVFSLSTPLVMLRTLRSPMMQVTGVVMGTWLVKVVLVIVVLALVRNADWLDPQVLGIVLLVGVLGSLALDLRAVTDTRLPYVSPQSGPANAAEDQPDE